jgi:hypothetical protein
MLGAISTVAAIALASSVVRPPETKADGWKLRLSAAVPVIEGKMSTDQLILVTGSYASSTNTSHYTAATQALNKLDALKAELASYGALPAGWDGEGSVPAEATHVDAANLILGLLPAGIPLPKPMLSADGEVGLYWKSKDYLADAVIEDKHHFSLFIRSLKQGNREIFIPAVAIGADATAAITAAFQAV